MYIQVIKALSNTSLIYASFWTYKIHRKNDNIARSKYFVM